LLKEEGRDHLEDLPPPEVLAQEIVEHLKAAMVSFRDLAAGPRTR
jgi:type I restriction enzyme M protein